MEKTIHLNADIGEGLDNEQELMPFLSACNIACGGHAGNADTIQKSIQIAQKHRVAIGAHPSYPDPENFGRSVMQISQEDLLQSLREQLNVFQQMLRKENGVLNHIKLHGALYNQATKDAQIAKVIIALMEELPQNTKLFAPYDSDMAALAREQHIPVVYEAFADRRYQDDLQLVPRSQQNGVINDFDEAFQQIYSIFSEEKVTTISNKIHPIKAMTFCVHGDHPNAIDLVVYLQQALAKKRIKIDKLQ